MSGKRMYWIPRQLLEDPQKLSDIRPDSNEWASQELHLFIVTDAGKPIFTRYGTIPMVSPIMCSYYAISSLMESLHEELDHFRAGNSTFVFLRRQSFIFIAVSKVGLPITYLFTQLKYLYLLFLSLFSEYILTQISQKPSIDFRLYAEPNRPTWNGVINNMTEDPAFVFVPSIPVTCFNPKLRQAFSNSQSLSRLQSCKLSMLIKRNRVVAFGSQICDPTSLRLIIDLVWTPVFQDEEHWVPLYLRDSNKTNFLFSHNLKGTDYYIVMLCGGNQEMDTYHSVSVALFNELIAANNKDKLAISMKRASKVFYFWALNSLTYGQVYVTDPDPRFFSDIYSKTASNDTKNLKENENQNENENESENHNQNSYENQNNNSNQDNIHNSDDSQDAIIGSTQEFNDSADQSENYIFEESEEKPPNYQNPYNSSSRGKMRELIRQLAKCYDYVKSNGNEGEFMFRGEKEVIVVYKNKEMELYAVAKSNELEDKDISQRLEELRKYVNDHINELLITENKLSVEEFV